jgi:hypothetical protein
MVARMARTSRTWTPTSWATIDCPTREAAAGGTQPLDEHAAGAFGGVAVALAERLVNNAGVVVYGHAG